MKSIRSQSEEINLITLWREFLPLSLSDVSMACGDPIITSTLAHLPDGRNNLAAVNIAKSLAIFLESPIIMILHAANALAPAQTSRLALWRFVLISGGSLSLLLGLLGLEPIFRVIGDHLLGVPIELSARVRMVILVMILWPLAIAWRRYFQGLLIYHGNVRSVAQASIARLITVGIVLIIGFYLQISGYLLAGLALVFGVIIEAIAVTIMAQHCGATMPPVYQEDLKLPINLSQIWRFYWPLANSMLVVWGGRAVLVGILARSIDAKIALAAWPAAWGLVLVIANSTRMVQQIVIKYHDRVLAKKLLIFAITVGVICSGFLLITSSTGIGEELIKSFIGNDRDLANSIKPILLICVPIPLLVALQNANQGFLVAQNSTKRVNNGTLISTSLMLIIALIMVQSNISGSIAAAVAMVSSIFVEVNYLLIQTKYYKKEN